MRARLGIAALLASLALAVAFPAAADAGTDGPGIRSVRAANLTIAKLLKQKAAPGSAAERELARKVTDSVRGFLDIEELGRRALVDHWGNLTPPQQQQFMTLLRELIEKSYIKGLRANLEYEVVFTGEKRVGEDIMVTTEIKAKRNGRPITVAVDYTLRQDGKDWRAFDVLTDGVGLVENYRAQFNKIIAKEGFEGLLRRMERKRDEA
jgi:phospholipid transport system substrate-binding protein